MATLAQLRTRVSRKLQDPDNTFRAASVIDDEINRSIDYYQNERFWFNEELATITLTADTQTVPSIPSDLNSPLMVNGLTLVDAQVKIDLVHIPPNQFVSMDQDQTGRPEYWTYRDGSFLLLPTPSSAYSLIFRYLKTYTDLSADGDTNDFTTYAPDLIMLHTLKNLYAEDKQDSEYGLMFSELERVELKSLKRRTEGYNATGKLQVDTIL